MSELNFFRAAECGNLQAIKSAVVIGMDLETKTERGWTALTMAAFNQHFEVVKFLIECGANVNHANLNGTTVLMYAKTKVLETGDYTLLDCLLEAGADVNLRDNKRDWTVLQYVQELKHTEMENYFIKNGGKT